MKKTAALILVISIGVLALWHIQAAPRARAQAFLQALYTVPVGGQPSAVPDAADEEWDARHQAALARQCQAIAPLCTEDALEAAVFTHAIAGGLAACEAAGASCEVAGLSLTEGERGAAYRQYAYTAGLRLSLAGQSREVAVAGRVQMDGGLVSWSTWDAVTAADGGELPSLYAVIAQGTSY